MGQGINPHARRGLGLLAALVAGCLTLPGTAGAAQIDVTTTADNLTPDAECTLREAIDAAVANAAIGSGCTAGDAGQDTIVLASGATYQLTLPTSDEFGNSNGDLDVGGGGPITLLGSRVDPPTITTDQPDRIIELTSPQSDVTLANLNVASGNATTLSDPDGGLIFVEEGKLTLQGVDLNDGSARDGGAIEVGAGAALDMSGSTAHKNSATRGGGAISLAPNAAPSRIADSVIRDNVTEGANAGGQLRGGGVLHVGQELVIERTTIQDNKVANSADAPNSDALGGGLLIGGTTNVFASAFVRNVASAAHAEARQIGGGIAMHGTPFATPMFIINSTLADNVAGRGGAIGGTNHQGNVLLSYVTFAGNTAVDPKSADHLDTTGSGSLSLTLRALLIDNSDGSKACVYSPGTLVNSNGYSVMPAADPDCEFGEDDLAGGGADLDLTSTGAEDNGGPVPTVAIGPDSDARDLVPGVECIEADARGVQRPAGKACDVGAYEYATCGGVVIGANAIIGTPGDDVLEGTAGKDVILGQGGNDKINAKGGKDRVCGGEGKDDIKAAGGNDLLYGEGGNDRIAGNGGNDRLFGGRGKDKLNGGPGRDRLNGGPGKDTLKGGPGKDKLNGGPGKDKEKQ